MKNYLYLLLLVYTSVAGQTIRVTDGAPLTVQSRLQLTTGIANQSGLRFTNLPYTSPATSLSISKFLTVDNEGNVILGSINSGGRQGVETAGLWQMVGTHLQNSNAGGVIIGDNISVTPAGYNLYVSQGILAERVKVAVKSTDEWSDKVFAPSYKLAKLPEVEAYVARFQHLPGVVSAGQVVREGLDLGQMNAVLLEKVEEVYLHLIRQEKAISRLTAENKKMKGQLQQLRKKAGR